jgi:hypothetical protein
VLHIDNIRLDSLEGQSILTHNSGILAKETKKSNILSSLWKLVVMACKEQGREGEKRSSINCPLASERGRP